MKKILFMEDELTIRDVLTEYMKMQNYQVAEAADGEEAILALENDCYDMAVLDIMVPKKNGLEVLDYIRSRYPDMPVIMLTALGDEQTQLKAFNAYADDYVIKPVSPIILLKRMETILRRAARTPKIEESGLVIHKESYQAFYSGTALELTLSEFLFLWYWYYLLLSILHSCCHLSM